MNFISDQGLIQLKNYKYKPGGYSYLDNKINPFWIAIVEFMPTWLAPNLITFIGFVTILFACTIQVLYDWTLTQEVPRWTFFFMAFAIFVYQTLDAIDGKQARRTGSSSPLGQLFDHGCDSFVLTFFVIALAIATKMDKDTVFYLFFLCQIGLWGINQKEYITGVLHTNLANFGVTELELVAIAVELISGFFGQDIWHFKVMGFECYKLVCHSILIIACICNLYLFYTNITNSNTIRPLLEWIPLFVFWGLQFVWFESAIYEIIAAPILICFGIILSLITCKMIVCSTTGDGCPLFHVEMIPFIVGSFISLFFEFTIGIQLLIFWITFLLSVILALTFLIGVIHQITTFLGIDCFKIKEKK